MVAVVVGHGLGILPGICPIVEEVLRVFCLRRDGHPPGALPGTSRLDEEVPVCLAVETGYGILGPSYNRSRKPPLTIVVVYDKIASKSPPVPPQGPCERVGEDVATTCG